MINKKYLHKWITQIDEYREQLRTGAGVLISSGYSKENDELYAAATACRDLLTLYSAYDSLSRDQLKRLETVMGELPKKAASYENAKKTQSNSYSLDGDEHSGVAKAAGNKRIRLQAARKLSDLSTKKILPALDQIMKLPDPKNVRPLNDEAADYENKLGDPSASSNIITENISAVTSQNKKRISILDFHRRAVNAKNAFTDEAKKYHDNKTPTLKELKQAFKQINNINRLSLMKYESREEFLELYKANRLKIEKITDIYNWMKKCKNGDKEHQQKFARFSNYTGISSSDFDDLESKSAALEMIGRHMDAQISVFANREYVKMTAKEQKILAHKNLQDLKNDIRNTKNPQIPDEYKLKGDKLKLVQDLYKVKQLEQIKVKQSKHDYSQQEKSYINRSVGDKKLKRTFKFLTAQTATGIKALPKSQSGDLDKPVMTKAKLGKISIKHTSKNDHFTVGAHASLLGAQALGNVSCGFSLKNPMSTNISIMGDVQAYGARGVLKGLFKHKHGDASIRAAGQIASANAAANISIGHVYEADEHGNVKYDGYGINLKAGATASVFSGKVTSGFSLFGIRIGFEAKGNAIGIGAEAEYKFVPASGFRIGAAGTLGLGFGLTLVVDWRDAVNRFKKWRQTKAISREALKAKKAEEKQRKLEEEKKKADAKRKYRKNPHGAKDDNDIVKTTSESKNAAPKENTVKRSRSFSL